jgi:hypothetical protein
MELSNGNTRHGRQTLADDVVDIAASPIDGRHRVRSFHADNAKADYVARYPLASNTAALL